MIESLAADLCAVKDVRVATSRDYRVEISLPAECDVNEVTAAEQDAALFSDLAGSADWTIVIAPETDSLLAKRCETVIAAGGRLLGPSPQIVRLATDKQQLAEHLGDHGVRAATGETVPTGHVDNNTSTKRPRVDRRENNPLAGVSCLYFQSPAGFKTPSRDLPYPVVLKPIDGSGSRDVLLIDGPEVEIPPADSPRRVEQFVPGMSVSVAVLCGPAGLFSLPPCRQHLSEDRRFTYLGGSLPLTTPLAARATRLALAAVQTLKAPIGYLGVDLILGADSPGSEDTVIEVNPRLTTSYVGLRAATGDNLAEAMLAVAAGFRPVLCFRDEPVEFEADGHITRQELLT